MTNEEFQKHLQEIYDLHDIIGKSERKTVNELCYMLRMDDGVRDYNISIPPYADGVGWMCIPSVKECFISTKTLAMHVKEVVCEGYDNDFDGILLTVYVEE